MGSIFSPKPQQPPPLPAPTPMPTPPTPSEQIQKQKKMLASSTLTRGGRDATMLSSKEGKSTLG